MPASKISDLHGWDEFKDPAVVDWKSVRRLIEHEDLLVNQRITWLLSSQSFLLLLIGAMMTFMGNVCASKDAWKQFCNVLSGDLLLLPPLIGLVTSAFAAITISQAERQSRVVGEWWHTHYPDSFFYHPPAFPRRPDRRQLFACWFRYSMLASIFAAAWAGLILAIVHVQLLSPTLITANPGVVLFFVLQMVLAVPYVYLAFGFGEVSPDVTSAAVSIDTNRPEDGRLRRTLRQSRVALGIQVSNLRRMYQSGRLWVGLVLPAVFLSKALFDPAVRNLLPGSLWIALFTVLAAMMAYSISKGQRSSDYAEQKRIRDFDRNSIPDH